MFTTTHWKKKLFTSLSIERLEDRTTPAAVGVSVGVGDIDGDGHPDSVAGAGAGGKPEVKVFSGKDGAVIRDFLALDAAFTGGVFVAVGDVTGDGHPDIAVGVGNGGAPEVKVYDGPTGGVVRDFFPYEATFTGGVNVGLGDIDGDGQADIITGTGVGGGPRVQVFSGKDGSTLRNFFAYESTFRGGVNIATGDVDGDRKADIITGTGIGGGPRIHAFSGADGSTLANFFAYEPDFRGGVIAGAADIDGDGKYEILAGSGIGGGPVAKAFGPDPANPLLFYFAFDLSLRSGVNVAGGDLDGDGKAEIVAGSGPGNNSLVQISRPDGSPLRGFSAFDTPGPTGGFASHSSVPPTVPPVGSVPPTMSPPPTVPPPPVSPPPTAGSSPPALTAPSTDPMSMAPNATAAVTFTTIVTGTLAPPTSVAIQEVDSGGNVIATLGSLADNGSAPDLRAGDGVYTGTFNVTVGAADTNVLFRTVAVVGGQPVDSDTASILATIAPAGFAAVDTSTAVTDPADGTELIPNQLLVQFVPGTTMAQIDAVAAAEGGTLVGAMPALGVYQFAIPGPADADTVNAAIDQWKTHPEVADASGNSLASAADVPPDGGAAQYGYYKIQANDARDLSDGSRTIVAVLDTGVDLTNPDLSQNVFAGLNFGSPGDAFGTTDVTDYNGHGTHVTGILAANSGDGGVSGVSEAPVLFVKVFNDDPYHPKSAFSSISTGIVYAVARGAKVLNMSLGGSNGTNLAMKAAVLFAEQQGRLIVASAGNTGLGDNQYPAAYSGVLSVGNTDGNDEMNPTSTHGDWVKITAPGTDIRSTVPKVGGSILVNASGYNTLSGTSMAAPQVAGAAALVWTKYPDLTAGEVMARLMNNGDDLSGSTHAAFPNAKRLNAYNAIRPTDTPPPPVLLYGNNFSSTTIKITLDWTSDGFPTSADSMQFLAAQITFLGQTGFEHYYLNGQPIRYVSDDSGNRGGGNINHATRFSFTVNIGRAFADGNWPGTTSQIDLKLGWVSPTGAEFRPSGPVTELVQAFSTFGHDSPVYVRTVNPAQLTSVSEGLTDAGGVAPHQEDKDPVTGFDTLRITLF